MDLVKLKVRHGSCYRRLFFSGRLVLFAAKGPGMPFSPVTPLQNVLCTAGFK